jgi:peptidoglycan/LPS O-acetylase OafA/YrhL
VTYARKRFLTIYPAYWIAYVATLLILFMMGIYTAPVNVPKWKFIYTIFGIDGLLAISKYATFYLVGEWFIGVIVIFYILFPLLYDVIQRFPIPSAVIILILHIPCIFFQMKQEQLQGMLNATVLTSYMILGFAFGIYFVKYIKKVNLPMVLFSFMALVVINFLGKHLPETAMEAVVSIAIFFILMYIADFIQLNCIVNLCRIGSKYSYTMFLIHHIVILVLNIKYDVLKFTPLENYALFTAMFAIICFLGWVIYKLERNVINLFN